MKDVFRKCVTRFAFSALIFVPLASFGQSDPEGRSSQAIDELGQRIESGKPSLGLRIGPENVDRYFNRGLGYGIEFGFEPVVPFSVAVELSGTAISSESNEPSITRTKLLAKGAYNFGGTTPIIRYSHVGAGIGMVHDNLGNEGKLNLGLGPHIGFDIPLAAANSQFSLGASLAYLFVTGNGPDALSANGVVKYWF